MSKFNVLKKKTIRWDGRDETASYFGYGDYTDTKWVEVGIVEAENEKEARKFARKIFKENKWRCHFAGVGINCLLEEIK